MTVLRVDTISGIGSDGPVFDGDLEFNSQNYVILPKGTTDNRVGVGSTAGALRYNTDSNKVELWDGNQWVEVQSSRPDLNGGARGVFGGGRGPAAPVPDNIIDYITISSTGNALDFGDLTVARRRVGACASSTRGVWGGGYNPDSNVLDYITISSTGNALDFGDLTVARRTVGSTSNATRGIWAGGTNNTPLTDTVQNVIDYITISSTGNAVDFGDLTIARDGPQGCSSSTRGIFAGGISNPSPLTNVNVIDYITISTLGNATDFGDLTITIRNCGACSNATRGIFAGAYTPTAVNTIQYVTIATLGNAVKFGELIRTGGFSQGVSSSTRGVWGGAYSQPESYINVIQYVNIATQSNAIDFGDLTRTSSAAGACSNAHGGL